MSEEQAQTCTLYTVSGEHSSFHLAFRPADYRFLALQSVLLSDKSTPKVADWTKFHFSHSESFTQPSSYCTIPEYLFDRSKALEYLKLSGIDTDHSGSDTITLLKCSMVYPTSVSDEGLRSSHASLLNYVASKSQANATRLHLHLDVEKLNLFVLQNGSLKLANAFLFKSKEDILYHALSVCRQLSLDATAIETSYSGFLRPKTALHKLFHEHFRKAAPLSLPDSLRFDPCFATLPKHLYLDAFILPTCE